MVPLESVQQNESKIKIFEQRFHEQPETLKEQKYPQSAKDNAQSPHILIFDKTGDAGQQDCYLQKDDGIAEMS